MENTKVKEFSHGNASGRPSLCFSLAVITVCDCLSLPTQAAEWQLYQEYPVKSGSSPLPLYLVSQRKHNILKCKNNNKYVYIVLSVSSFSPPRVPNLFIHFRELSGDAVRRGGRRFGLICSQSASTAAAGWGFLQRCIPPHCCWRGEGGPGLVRRSGTSSVPTTLSKHLFVYFLKSPFRNVALMKRVKTNVKISRICVKKKKKRKKERNARFPLFSPFPLIEMLVEQLTKQPYQIG